MYTDMLNKLQELTDACIMVKEEYRACDKCPRAYNGCLEYVSLMDFVYDYSSNMIEEFMQFAKECEFSDEDRIAVYADAERKAVRDEMEDIA